MKAGCRATSSIVARGRITTPNTRRIKISFADKYDDRRALVSLTLFQTAEYDGLSFQTAPKSRQLRPLKNQSFMLTKYLLPVPSRSDSGTGGVSPASAQVGTRASGMAGAYVGVADDATAVYWNPAGVATGSLVSVVIGGGGQTVARGAQLEEGQQDTAAVVAISATALGFAYYRLGTYGRSAPEPAVIRPPEPRRSAAQCAGDLDIHNRRVARPVSRTIRRRRRHAKIYVRIIRRGVRQRVRRRCGCDGRDEPHPAWISGAQPDHAVVYGWRRGRGRARSRSQDWRRLGLRMDRHHARDRIGGRRPDVAADALGRSPDVAAGVETWWMGQRLGLRGGARRSTIGDARAAFAAGISAGLSPGMLLEAHVVRGHAAEHSWSVGARMLF